MAEFREHGGGGFRAPPGQTRIAIGGVADECEVVGDRRGRHAEFRDHPGFVADDSRAAIELHDTGAANRLRQVLIGRADVDALDAWVEGGACGRRRQRIVGFEFNHRPDLDPRDHERVLEQWELREPDRPECRRLFCSRATDRCGTTR